MADLSVLKGYLTSALDKTGDFTSSLFDKIIKWVSSLGISITENQTKIVSMIILLGIFILILKLVSWANKPLKFIILLLIVILIISIIFSF